TPSGVKDLIASYNPKIKSASSKQKYANLSPLSTLLGKNPKGWSTKSIIEERISMFSKIKLKYESSIQSPKEISATVLGDGLSKYVIKAIGGKFTPADGAKLGFASFVSDVYVECPDDKEWHKNTKFLDKLNDYFAKFITQKSESELTYGSLEDCLELFKFNK
ncbi:MAG: hypothetical protein MHPSP_002228, partial [Paramarteilia canceri]